MRPFLATVLVFLASCGHGNLTGGAQCSLSSANDCASGVCLVVECATDNTERTLCAFGSCDSANTCPSGQVCANVNGTHYCAVPPQSACGVPATAGGATDAATSASDSGTGTDSGQ